MEVSRTRFRADFHGFIGFLAALTWFTLLALPKAGLYISGAPLTAGYVLAVGTSAFVILAAATGGRQLCSDNLFSLLTALLAGIGVAILLVPHLTGERGTVLATILALCVVPSVGLVLGDSLDAYLGERRVKQLAFLALMLVATFGLLQWLVANLVHRAIGIPYVTATGNDVDSILARSNRRGSLWKMASTYHNGNLLGISLALWAPVARGTKDAIATTLHRLVGLLSLARIGWLGLALVEARPLVRRQSALRTLKALVAMMLIGVVFILFAQRLGGVGSFLFDSTLGGRSDQFAFGLSWLGHPIENVQEIVYLSMLEGAGIVGLVVFCIGWLHPAFLAQRRGSMRMPVALTCLTYAVLMGFDGGFYLIPVQMIYWTTIGFLQRVEWRKSQIGGIAAAF